MGMYKKDFCIKRCTWQEDGIISLNIFLNIWGKRHSHSDGLELNFAFFLNSEEESLSINSQRRVLVVDTSNLEHFSPLGLQVDKWYQMA